MKYILPLFAFLLVVSSTASGQRKEPYPFLKTGQITVEDLKLSKYAPDTSAGAVYLFDSGKTHFSSNAGNGISITHERHVVIKILKKSAYDAANIEIPVYLNENLKESVSGITGFTYNLVGGKMEVTKLGKEAIFEEKTTRSYNLKKFTLPNVKVGSVIEFTYRIQSPFIFVFQPWNFQHRYPVAWSEYRAEIPDNFMYKTLFQGYEPIAFTEEKKTSMSLNFTEGTVNLQGKENRWVMLDVPALHQEAFISSLRNFQSRIEFELTNINTHHYAEERKNNTWEKISENLLKSDGFGFYFSRTGFTKEFLSPVITGITDPEKKLAAIHKYISNYTTADETDGIYPRQPLRKVLETKKGTPSEINLLLLCFLREAGFTANPVLLSTREHGLVTELTYPNIQKFNYVVVHVKTGEKAILLDATEPLAPLNLLPTECLNGSGLILSATDVKWVDLRAGGKASQMYYTKVNLASDLSMSGKMQVSSNGYAALDLRQQLAKQGDKKFIDGITSNHTVWEIGTYTLNKNADPFEPMKYEISFSIPAQNQAPGTIYLQPVIHQTFKQNPLMPETRKFPIDLTYPVEETMIFNYTVPEGYQIEEQPKDAIITLPDNGGKYAYSVTALGNSINVVSKLTFDRALFSTEEYPYLKEFYNQMLAKQSEQIVLKKISAETTGKPKKN